MCAEFMIREEPLLQLSYFKDIVPTVFSYSLLEKQYMA